MGSVAAQELQERILNDVDTALLDNTKEQTLIMQTMKEALQQMVKHTDPNQHSFTGGSI